MRRRRAVRLAFLSEPSRAARAQARGATLGLGFRLSGTRGTRPGRAAVPAVPPPVPPAKRTARSGNKGRRLDSAQARAAPLAGLAVFKVSLRYSQIGAWQAEFRTKEAAIRSHAAAHGETVTQHCSAESPAAYLAASSAFTQMEHFRSQTSRRSLFWLLASLPRPLRRE